MQAIGLVTLFIGITNALDLNRVSSPPGVLVGLLALALGAALGEWWRIEEGLENLGDRLKRRFRGSGRFTEGFVAASLLFCVGPLALLGSIQNGLTGEDRKSTRLNSSHVRISYAVFCLKKKKTTPRPGCV